MSKPASLTKRHAIRMLTAAVNDAVLTMRKTAPHQRKAVVLEVAERTARKHRIDQTSLDTFKLLMAVGMPDIPPPLSKRELRRREKEMADELSAWLDQQEAAIKKTKTKRKR